MRALLPVRLSLIAAILPALVLCNAAMAQVSAMVSPTPIVGATSPEQVEANARAAGWALTPEDLAAVDRALGRP